MNEFLLSLLFRVVEIIFFMGEVGLLETFQNITLQPLLLNNFRVIAPVVRNACCRYFSLIVKGKDLKLLLMYSVHLAAPSNYHTERTQGPLLAVIAP